MGRVLEHSTKELIARSGVSVPRGDVASSVDEAYAIAESLGVPVAIKAQVIAGKRGKAGGVRLADSPADAAEAERGRPQAVHRAPRHRQRRRFDLYANAETTTRTAITSR